MLESLSDFLDDLPFGGRSSCSLISMGLTSNHDLRAFRQNLHFPRKEVTPHESHKLPTKYRETLWDQQIKLNHAVLGWQTACEHKG